MTDGLRAKIEVAWSKRRAEKIAVEERADGRDALVAPYDAETYCVHVSDPYGTQTGLAARFARFIPPEA